MERRVLIVGIGGIGSWAMTYLIPLIKAKQIEHINFTIADPDIIENKNLIYQNYTQYDVLFFKAPILCKFLEDQLRIDDEYYSINFEPLVKKIINKKDLVNYDAILSAVDNLLFRQLMFDFVFKKNTECMWWDLRAEGRVIAGFSKHNYNTLEKMMLLSSETKTSKKKKVEPSTSCQHVSDLSKGIIQQGNKIIALIWTQWYLDWYRGIVSPAEFHLML